MGFVANAISSILGGGRREPVPVSAAPVQDNVTARDLVASTSSSDPDSATMGSDSKKQKRKRGKAALMINKNQNTTSGASSTGLNI